MLRDVALDLHAHPELALQEHHAAEVLGAALEGDGFALERGVAGMPTAFVGRSGSGRGGPRVAVLMEYDALPGVGHACGHNLIAAGGLGAALAARQALGDVPGELMAVGSPAEEAVGGKIIELEAGVFDGVDAALMFHPGTHNWPIRHATACMDVTMRFYGKAAHAAGAQAGINALNPVIHTFVGIDGLRQHMPETARIHGIVTNGGQAPNIVPEYAEASFIVRALTMEACEQLWQRVRAIAEAAAAMSGARVEFDCGRIYAERKNNRLLADLYAQHLRATGERVEAATLKGGTGSSDIGNISLRLPTIHPYAAVAEPGVAGHSREMTRAAASERGLTAMLHVAQALAHTAVDLFLDPGLVTQAWEVFRTTGPDLPA